MNNSG
jgi:FMNH2-dependent dimethyl sulfone monooxygenase